MTPYIIKTLTTISKLENQFDRVTEEQKKRTLKTHYKEVKEYRNSLKTALSAEKSQQSSDIPPYETAEAQYRGFYMTILTLITAQCVKFGVRNLPCL